LSLIEPHNEFLELCAVSTSGDLTEDEQKKLQEHLVVCEPCRQILQQYQAIVKQAIPAIAASEASGDLEPSADRTEEQAEKVFFEHLAHQEARNRKREDRSNEFSPIHGRFPAFSSESTWRHVWMLYAAGILLFVSLSFYAYRAGIHRGTDSAQVARIQPSTQNQTSLEARISDAGYDLQIARTQIEFRDKTIADLRRQLAQRADEFAALKAAQVVIEDDLKADNISRQELAQQQIDLVRKLDGAGSDLQVMQQKADSLARQSAQDAARAKALESKVNELNGLLHDREAALDEKDELLAHDRDIRDLMGARDLYIAEVYDVARTGETQKPYGRVFYTRGKSLIFYAYDLDQAAAMRKANAFQAWGRRGPDRQAALNLGVFYQDNGSHKRWILKCDDPKMLAQIDAVFVTVEPNGGSQRPSGKSLLFAYLRVDANHP
jgi:Anti-sigma-K factor rskA